VVTAFSYHQLMATDLQLYLVKPGDQGYSNQTVGRFSVRSIECSGQTVGSMRCLGIEVEAHGPQSPLGFKDEKGIEHPLIVSWLQLGITVATNSTPRRDVGKVHVDQRGMLPFVSGTSGRSTWTWEVTQEDVETVERTRSGQAAAPISLYFNVTGIAKLIDESGRFLDLVPIQCADAYHQMELSHWERLISALGYGVPPSQAALVGTATQEHPSWGDAERRLANARSHLRKGEDYDALRQSLSAIEALVTAPYNVNSWKPLLIALPAQKADGLAELLSGFATFCNRIGHHRERSSRDGSGDLATMPLDHWEADIAVALAQYVLTYASRLRMGHVLAEAPPVGKAATETTS
jgi:hypothetical protein